MTREEFLHRYVLDVCATGHWEPKQAVKDAVHVADDLETSGIAPWTAALPLANQGPTESDVAGTTVLRWAGERWERIAVRVLEQAALARSDVGAKAVDDDRNAMAELCLRVYMSVGAVPLGDRGKGVQEAASAILQTIRTAQGRPLPKGGA